MKYSGFALPWLSGLFAMTLVTALGTPAAAPATDRYLFLRGDADQNFVLSIEDAYTLLGYLFLHSPEKLDCEAAGDWNDDGQVDISDALSVIFYFFGGWDPPQKPYPSCGEDPTPDLPCDHYWFCGTGDLWNGIGLRLLPVPTGSFRMGSPSSERGHMSDEFLHLVTISCDFYLSENEVTQGEYLEIMGENPSWHNGVRDVGLGQKFDYGYEPARPVEMVTWLDAREFCRRLSDREQRKYRLPFEAEWEYACRAGTTTRLWFGDMLQCPEDQSGCADAAPYMWSCVADWCGSTRVGLKAPNPWGFYDIAGHVAEWCQDWYAPYPTGPVVDPTGPAEGKYKVFRGLADYATHGLEVARSAKRHRSTPDQGVGTNLGFRVVLELPACVYGD